LLDYTSRGCLAQEPMLFLVSAGNLSWETHN